MKKISMILAAAMLLGLAACGGASSSSTAASAAAAPSEPASSVAESAPEAAAQPLDMAEVAGAYSYTYEEEMEGEIISVDFYLMLNSDGTGTWLLQDVVPLEWDGEKISTMGIDYTYTLEGNELTMKDGDYETVYTRLEGELPEGIAVY